MIFWIAKLIASITGFDISKVQRAVLIAIIGAIGVAILVLGLWVRSCVSQRNVKFDHETVDRINNQNAADAKVEVREMVKENADVLTTIDGRTTISNLSEEEQAKEIERVTAAAAAKVEAAKQIKGNVTGPELECILLPEKCQ